MTRESKIELTIGLAILIGIGAIFILPRYLRSKGEPARPPADAPMGPSASGTSGPKAGQAVAAVVPSAPAKKASDAEAPKAAKPPPMETPAAAKPAPGDAGEWRKHLEKGNALMAKDRYWEARMPLTNALLAAPEGETREGIKKALYQINNEMLFSPHPIPESRFHVVKPGESLWRLSQKYNTPIGLIKWVNGKRRDTVRPGERLKVIVGDWSALVQKSGFRLLVFFKGGLVREYPVTIGKYGKTPEGTFTIKTKEVNPTWYAPDGVYPHGDPKNVLGSRWLGFQNTPNLQGYGIHGTSSPDQIGRAVSNGCVRLRNKDVEELYLLLRRGDKVTIVP